MHTYERIPQPDPLPEGFFDLGSHPLRCPEDVEQWARRHPTIGWMTWPEVWHLDHDGRFCCYYQGSTPDSIKRWADDPSDLQWSRDEGRRTTGCTDHWLIVDSRPTKMRDGPTVDESDVEAFLRLRPQVEAMGVHLLDVLIFDDQCHWWSLHGLTTGSTAWAPPPLRQAS